MRPPAISTMTMQNDTVSALLLTSLLLGCGNDEVVAGGGTPFDLTEPEPPTVPRASPPDSSGGDASVGGCQRSVWEISAREIEFSRLAPNLYILLDTSGSMGEWENCADPDETGCCDDCLTTRCCWGSCCDQRTPPFPIDQAKIALDGIADALAGHVRFGIGTFPSPTSLGLPSCGMTEHLPIGTHPARQVKSSYASAEPEGSTPTGASLWMIRDRDNLTDTTDEHDARRSRALVLITDGEPTYCEERYPALDEARALHEIGVDIYVVGFRSAADEETLNALAATGGTNNPNDPERRFFIADDTEELLAALDQIARSILGCTHDLEPPPEHEGDVRMSIDGRQLAPTEFSLAGDTVSLSVDVCEALAADDADARLRITIDCAD